jgi:hypothetical protein
MVTDIHNNPISKLNVGDEIKVPTLFGIFTMIVSKVEEGYAQAMTKSGGLAAELKLEKSGWNSTYCFNPKAICKVQIID